MGELPTFLTLSLRIQVSIKNERSKPLSSNSVGMKAQANQGVLGGWIRISPLAKKVAEKYGVNILDVKGSGPSGRIVKNDIEKYKEESLSGFITPLKKMTSHCSLHLKVNVGRLMVLCSQINAQVEQTHGNKFSVNDFIIKSIIHAARAIPQINVSVENGSINPMEQIKVSVEISTEEGIVAPVIKEAEAKSMLELSKEVKSMVERARLKKLHKSECEGHSIVVSNLGELGIKTYDEVLHTQHALVITARAIEEKSVVVDGKKMLAQSMDIGLICDLRAVKRVLATRFLNEVKRLLENPTLMLI